MFGTTPLLRVRRDRESHVLDGRTRESPCGIEALCPSYVVWMASSVPPSCWWCYASPRHGGLPWQIRTWRTTVVFSRSFYRRYSTLLCCSFYTVLGLRVSRETAGYSGGMMLIMRPCDELPPATPTWMSILDTSLLNALSAVASSTGKPVTETEQPCAALTAAL